MQKHLMAQHLVDKVQKILKKHLIIHKKHIKRLWQELLLVIIKECSNLLKAKNQEQVV